jgi:hypothetical protein
MKKSRRDGLDMGEMKNPYKILVENLEEIKHLWI